MLDKYSNLLYWMLRCSPASGTAETSQFPSGRSYAYETTRSSLSFQKFLRDKLLNESPRATMERKFCTISNHRKIHHHFQFFKKYFLKSSNFFPRASSNKFPKQNGYRASSPHFAHGAQPELLPWIYSFVNIFPFPTTYFFTYATRFFSNWCHLIDYLNF